MANDNILVGNYGSMTEPKSQVYWATHDGEGNILPFMHRSFISFSYGGKNIEDFDLIVVTDGDRISRGIYADFTNNVTESEILDEKFFWASHFNGNQLSLVLATDGIDEKTLEKFKVWFAPGIKRELILSEHPNRVIDAYLESAPQYSFLPFEKKTEVKIHKKMYKTSTTLYKGEINITFTMDEPYWHAKSNLLCYKNEDDTEDYDNFLAANGIKKFIFGDPDASKIILEDGIATNVQITSENILFGNTVKIDASTIPETSVGSATIEENPIARIGPIFTEATGFSFGKGNPENRINVGDFYYPGTAPSKPIISFTLLPEINEQGYICTPRNTFSNPKSSEPYNKLTLLQEISGKMEFCFTTPSIWTGYNQVISILIQMDGEQKIDVRRAIRMGVNHFAPRDYAINYVCNGSGVLNASAAIEIMKKFLQDGNDQYFTASFSFNSKTGKSIGTFSYRKENPVVNTKSFSSLTEDVGDMVRSDYLIITDRNHPVNGYIEKRTDLYPDYSYILYHNVANGLQNVFLEYTNKYY